MAELSKETIHEDILTIVGGNFNALSLGLQVYEEILARTRGNADLYLNEFQGLFLGERFDPILQSSLHLPYFLGLMAEDEPARVKTLTNQLLKQYNAVMAFHDAVEDRAALHQVLPENVIRMTNRFESRRTEFKNVLQTLQD